ncbi:MAG: polyprenyl synthetase family protein [Muribaculaceae bacterium]|nr:polyprenyl synthetase family protein [Muribaculaceae bacterium]
MKYTTAYFSGLVEAALADLEYPAGTPRLFEPIRYTLEGGGKRLRPSLLLATYAALSHRDAAEVMNQALAVEMFHNFTLLHDDVMDRAELRRGRPTVHVRWNSNAAILSGDAMLTLSTMLLARCDSRQLPALLGLFDTTAMEVYQGQQLDMEFERRNDVTVNEYLEMIRLKTSVLLACACAMGARLAGAPEKVVNAMYAYGEDLGLAFQLRDDWLDTYGDAAVFGKEIGGDILNRKKTWLLISALGEAPDELGGILSEDLDDAELIRQVRGVYDSLDLGARCCALADRYAAKAVDSLGAVPLDAPAREFFEKLAAEASRRNH